LAECLKNHLNIMKLTNNHILVSPTGGEKITKGGIYIPEHLIEKRNRGTITHIGTDVDPELLGKEILFVLAAAQDFNYDNVSGKLIFTTDIIATLN
jgi:co-chaperonin GroES (HSP10)